MSGGVDDYGKRRWLGEHGVTRLRFVFICRKWAEVLKIMANGANGLWQTGMVRRAWSDTWSEARQEVVEREKAGSGRGGGGGGCT